MVRRNRHFADGAAPSGGWTGDAHESYVDSKTSIHIDERLTDRFIYRMENTTLPDTWVYLESDISSHIKC